VFLPVVDGYRYVTPSFLRTGVSNFFNNLGDVPNLLNSLLQLKGHRSMETTGRLLLNTTIGIAGLWDPATAMGLPRQTEDFGQTLGFYGVPAGAYLVLPILGPSNLRDTGGLIVDYSAEGDQLPQRGRSQLQPPGDLGPARRRQALPDQLPLWPTELAVRV
jgi:phospholipid-binding lipoprotein MlaA